MRNKIVAGLIVATGLLFTAALFTPDRYDHESFVTAGKLAGLGFITGLSAVATRFLIKEKNNG
jgi:hypothetical protein